MIFFLGVCIVNLLPGRGDTEQRSCGSSSNVQHAKLIQAFAAIGPVHHIDPYRLPAGKIASLIDFEVPPACGVTTYNWTSQRQSTPFWLGPGHLARCLSCWMARAAWRSTCRRGRKTRESWSPPFCEVWKVAWGPVRNSVSPACHEHCSVTVWSLYMLISSYNLYHLISWLHLATFSWSDAAISTVRQRLVTNTFFPLPVSRSASVAESLNWQSWDSDLT